MLHFPTMFKIYIKEAVKIWKVNCKGLGFNMNIMSVFTLQCAHDQDIAANSKHDI